MLAFDLMTRLVSPYQFNPLDFNPLRDVLEQSIDFKRLRRDCQIDLYIAATDIATGKPRIFRNRELTVDCLLASACLPHLHRAVKIGRRHYWDGGFSANPPLLPLVEAGTAEDTLIVQLDAAVMAKVPTDARAIIARVNHLTFSGPLKHEVETIERLRGLAADGGVLGGPLGRALGGARRRRIHRHRFHHIAAGPPTRKLGAGSRLNPDWALLCRLRDMGRGAAEAWLRQNADALGRRSTVDLAAKFL
jgi:NTE family protein